MLSIYSRFDRIFLSPRRRLGLLPVVGGGYHASRRCCSRFCDDALRYVIGGSHAGQKHAYGDPVST